MHSWSQHNLCLLGIAEAATEEAPLPIAKGWLQNAARKAPLGRYMPVLLCAILHTQPMANTAHLQNHKSQMQFMLRAAKPSHLSGASLSLHYHHVAMHTDEAHAAVAVAAGQHYY